MAAGYSPARSAAFQAAMYKLAGFMGNATTLVGGPGRVYAQPPFDYTNFTLTAEGGLGAVGNAPIAAFPMAQDVMSWTEADASHLGFTAAHNLSAGIAGQEAVHIGSRTTGGLAAFLANSGASYTNYLFGLPTNWRSFLEIGSADNDTRNASASTLKHQGAEDQGATLT